MTNTSAQTDARGLAWITINNFAAGIQQRNFPLGIPGTGHQEASIGSPIITSPQNPTAYLGGGPVAEGPGSPLTTAACIGPTTGGLTGLPSPQPINGSEVNSNVLGVTDKTVDSGDIVVYGIVMIDPGVGFSNATINSSIFAFVLYYVDSSGSHWTELRQLGYGEANNFLAVTSMTSLEDTFVITFPFIYFTEVGTTIYPNIGYMVYDEAGQNLVLYRSDATATSIDMTGYAFSHQGYVVNVAPFAEDFHSNTTLGLINFTYPPQTTTWPEQGELFFTNYFDSIATWGSLSASELLLITGNHGGIIVANDIYSPYVTTAPGVQGTGNLIGKSSVSPLGLVYCSTSGVWVWNGGQNSQFLSPQLNAKFWTFNNYYSDGGVFNCQSWGNWIVTQGNFLYDGIGQGWWVLNDPTPDTALDYYVAWWECGNVESYQCLIGVGSGGAWNATQCMLAYSYNRCASSWVYTSNLIQLSQGNVIDIRELVVSAMNSGTYTYTIAIALLLLGGEQVTLDSITVPPATNYLTQFRIPCECVTDMAQIAITVTSTDTTNTDGANFIIGSIAFGYKPLWKLAVT